MSTKDKDHLETNRRPLDASRQFGENIQTMLRVFAFFNEQVESLNASTVPKIRERGESAQARMRAAFGANKLEEVRGAASDFAHALEDHLTLAEVAKWQMRWHLVMLVTITEAHLQDALTEAAGLDLTLMEKSEQEIKYSELLQVASLEQVLAQMRMKWARKFVETGGPSKWITNLRRMGARGGSDDLEKTLEEAWGLRHLIVHRLGKVTEEFENNHPKYPLKAGSIVELDAESIVKYSSAMIEFSAIIRDYLEYRVGARLAESGKEDGTKSGLKNNES